MQCRKCKSELPKDITTCFVCGTEVEQPQESWVSIGYVEDSVMAGLVEETFKTCEIPAVVISKSGFFGSAGLPLNPVFSSASSRFEITVPASFVEKASVVLDAMLGENWNRSTE